MHKRGAGWHAQEGCRITCTRGLQDNMHKKDAEDIYKRGAWEGAYLKVVRHGLVHKDVYEQQAILLEPRGHPGKERLVVLHVFQHLYAHDAVVRPRGREGHHVRCQDLENKVLLLSTSLQYSFVVKNKPAVR
jgi:hypothetical protein